MRNQVWTISTLARYLKNSLDNDSHIQAILVKGEISNFTRHRSGHLYFSLKDEGSRMNCVMFSSAASKLRIQPKEGLQVLAKIKVSMYEPQGNLQLYVMEMQCDGIGDLYLAFEQLKQTLYVQGLFNIEHKKKLPLYPMSIAIISAKTGAAIQDVLSIIARRWPIAKVHVYSSLVQGSGASANIISQLQVADQNNHDVILLVRGGGSLEDLWCFNDENLAHCIYHLKTCIVSGVGHETDTTLVDYVSDLRAPTPSAAAELITPDKEQIQLQVTKYKQMMIQKMDLIYRLHAQQLEYYRDKPYFNDSEYYIQQQKLRLLMAKQGLLKIEGVLNENQYRYLSIKEQLAHIVDKQTHSLSTHVSQQKTKLIYVMQNLVNENKQNMNQLISLLDAYSPLKVLQRGYAIAIQDTQAIKSVEQVKTDDEIMVQVQDGIIRAIVKESKKYEK